MRNDARKIAEALAKARASGVKLTEPPGPDPENWDAAYAIQDALIEVTDSPVVGWKIGATSAPAQKRLGVDEPIAGPLFERWVSESPSEVDLPPDAIRIVEPEFAFRMAADLPPRIETYSEREVAGAAGALHAAIEVVDRRIAEPPDGRGFSGHPSWFAADAGSNGAFVIGPGREDWRTLDLPSLKVSVSVDGKAKTEGTASAALGSPLNALVWAANHLSRRGIGLKAGDWVSTGLVTEIFKASPGQSIRTEHEALGNVEVSFPA